MSESPACELFGGGDVVHDSLVFAEPFDQRFELRQGFRVLPVFGGIVLHPAIASRP